MNPATPHDAPVLTVTQAAQLAGMHPQTLRQYDRLGLVTPMRTRGRGRRYSLRDVEALRKVQHLAQNEGINLAGIKRILTLMRHVEMLEQQLTALLAADADQRAASTRTFAAGSQGDVVIVQRGRRATRAVRGYLPSGSGTTTTREIVVWNP